MRFRDERRTLSGTVESEKILTTEDTEDTESNIVSRVGFSLTLSKGELLRADDYFVGGCREPECNAARLVGLDGLGQVQRREFDLSVPGSGGVVVGAGVEGAVGDRVLGCFFAVAIAKD